MSRKEPMPWTLVTCGCGTANYWTIRELAHSVSVIHLKRLILCDCARIREDNAITCPDYAGFLGQPKSERLGELARQWLPKGAAVQSSYTRVEQMPWECVLGVSGEGHMIVLVGLDRWPSRMSVAETLRHLVARVSTNVVLIQVGLDRGQANISVYGCRFRDPCPACGLSSLPGPEPCVVRTADDTLLRGNLHLEAQAVAKRVRRIVEDRCHSSTLRRWVNTKTHLTVPASAGERDRCWTRRCRMVPGCLGPHTAATPIRWDGILESTGSRGEHS